MNFIKFEEEMEKAPKFTNAQIKCAPTASGIYTAWLEGVVECFYVGKASVLVNRLRSHYSGQRGCNQFCLYVYDAYVYNIRQPHLTTAQVNTLTAQWIRANVSFRWVEVSQAELSAHETYLRQKWHPILNPLVVDFANTLRPIGLAKGKFIAPDDFDDPLPDEIQRLFEGHEETMC